MSICWCRVFLYHFDATEHGEVKLLSAGSIQHVLVCFSISDAMSRQCGSVHCGVLGSGIIHRSRRRKQSEAESKRNKS